MRGKRLLGMIVLCMLVVFHLQIERMICETLLTRDSKRDEVLARVFSNSKSSPKKAEKTAYLTFDDGPSANTDKILDILKEKGVKATFFVVGKEGEKAKARYRRIVEEGHSLGMHSYSHKYEEIYASMEQYRNDLEKLRKYLYEVTGVKVSIYRFPGGSSNQVSKVPIEDCIAYLKEEGIEYYDWNASSEDAVLLDTECTVLNQNILKDALLHQNSMILMHDLLTCKGTVEALPNLVDRLLEEGYKIKAIDEDTIPVHHR